MGRPRTTNPKLYVLKDGTYRVTICGKHYRLGRDKAAAEAKRKKLVARWLLAGADAPPATAARTNDPQWLTVAEVLVRYVEYVREEGFPSQLYRISMAVEAACGLFGTEPTPAFDQLALQEVRTHLLHRPCRPAGGGSPVVEVLEKALSGGPVQSRELLRQVETAGHSKAAYQNARTRMGLVRFHREGSWWSQLPADYQPLVERPAKTLTRKYVNRLILCLQAAWDWCVSQKLAPNGSNVALRSVKPLKRKAGLRDNPDRQPVDEATMRATLPFLRPATQAMVLSQWHTGMRPGEVCRLQLQEISRSVDQPVPVPIGDGKTMLKAAEIRKGVLVWLYAPSTHKTLHRGKPRMVPVGPRAQAVLIPWLENIRPDQYLFRPERLKGERPGRKRPTGPRYTPDAYARAVRKACRKAGVPLWSPYQIRHATATQGANTPGVDREELQAALGHATPDMTAHYIAEQFARGADFAAEHG